MGMRNGNYRPRSICSCMQTKEPMQLYADQGAYAAVCRPCKEHMQLYADQGAYASVYRPRSLYRCMQTEEHMQLYAGRQGAYAAVCRPRSIGNCMQGKEPMQLYADQGAYAAVEAHISVRTKSVRFDHKTRITRVFVLYPMRTTVDVMRRKILLNLNSKWEHSCGYHS